jgi:hypothetical protein
LRTLTCVRQIKSQIRNKTKTRFYLSKHLPLNPWKLKGPIRLLKPWRHLGSCAFEVPYRRDNETAERPSLETLPPELLLEIFDYFSAFSADVARHTLLDLTYTCTQLKWTAVRFLYRHISLTRDEQEKQLRRSLEQNPLYVQYIRTYEGVDFAGLGWLLSKPLHLQYLKIPRTRKIPRRQNLDAWLNSLHKDLVVQVIELEMATSNHGQYFLNHMNRFKGLKVLRIICKWVGARKGSDQLDALTCPDLEHLVLESFSSNHFSGALVDKLPKLKSFVLQIEKDEMFFDWNKVSKMKDRGVYFNVEVNGSDNLLKMHEPLMRSAEIRGLDCDSFTVWILLSSIYLSLFGAARVDLRENKSARGLRKIPASDIIKMLDTTFIYEIMIAYTARCNNGTKGYLGFISPVDLVEIMLPRLIGLEKLGISCTGCTSGDIGLRYPKFTKASFEHLFRPPINDGKLKLTFSRGQKPNCRLTAEQLEDNKEFIGEVMGLFDLNPSLNLITIILCVSTEN